MAHPLARLSRLAGLCAVLVASLPFLAAQNIYTSAPTFSTFAGIPPGSADGPGATARFRNPAGTAVDSNGNIFVADTSNHTIRRITPGGVVSTFAGSPGVPGTASLFETSGSAARFSSPLGLAIDGSDNLYVVDSGNRCIRKITPAGRVSTVVGNPFSSFGGSWEGPAGSLVGFNYAVGIATDNVGNIYLTDPEISIVRRITPDGDVAIIGGTPEVAGTTDGPRKEALFSMPVGIAVDRSGTVYVGDAGSSTIRRITPGGIITTVAGSPGLSGSADGQGSAARFGTLAGLAADSAGNLYIADAGNLAIRRLTAAGQVTTLAGTVGVRGFADGALGTARLARPWGLSLNSTGDLYVADALNCSIRKVSASPSGQMTTVAGVGSTVYTPTGLAVDSGGNLYFSEIDNFTISRLSPTGVPAVVAGAPGLPGTADGEGTAARFSGPTGIAFDSAGNLFVADAPAHTIRRVTPAGNVTTFAGQPGASGATDGLGGAARFSSPRALAFDRTDRLYVADYDNNAIRRIASTGEVSTLVGAPGGGSSGGTLVKTAISGANALALDRGDNLYVAGYRASSITKITPVGVVSTFAGNGRTGSSDGTGAGASFNGIRSLAVDREDNVLVSVVDGTIRRITPGGSVTTVGGAPDSLASLRGAFADGPGASARFTAPYGLAVGPDKRLYVADQGNNAIRVGTPVPSPTLAVQPSSQVIVPGSTVALNVFTTEPGVTYQWQRDGVNLANGGTISGATSARLVITGATAINGGVYTCLVTNFTGTTASSPANLTTTVTSDPGRLINLSVLTSVQGSLSVGFVIGGANAFGVQTLLARAIGPALGAFGVTGVLPDPTLTIIRQNTSSTVTSNIGWASAPGGPALIAAANAATGAFALPDPASKDSALVLSLPLSPGGYAVRVAGASGGSGTALAEVYDYAAFNTPASPRLINLSCLTPIATGGTLSAGFVVGGSTSRTVLVRAIGPQLATSFSVGGTMVDPQVAVTPLGGSTVLAINTNWAGNAQITTANAAVGAFALTNTSSHDSAVLLTLAPGPYAAQVRSSSGSGGTVLVEIYEVP